jgi:hypothetical protein
MSSPHGTIVLITGANQGLGYLAALQLSKLPGYTVLIGARSPEKGANAVERILADTEGGHAQSAVETILVNQDEDETLYAAMKQIEAKFSKLDVLVVSQLPPTVSVHIIKHIISQTFRSEQCGGLPRLRQLAGSASEQRRRTDGDTTALREHIPHERVWCRRAY